MRRTDDPYTALEKTSLKRYIPLRAMLELTYRCNFRCVHCYLVEFRSPGELSREEWRNTLDDLASQGCLFLTLTGGEPLLRKDFFDIAGDARDRRFALRVFTNGSLVDESVAREFAKIGTLSTEVSLYGMTDEVSKAVTTKRHSAEVVLEAIQRLRSHGVPVKIKVPVLKQNLHELPAMRSFAERVGAGFLANPNITPRDDGNLAPLAHGLDDEALAAYYGEHVPKAGRKSLKPESTMCSTARNALVISPWGDVYPCVQIKESVGNVREKSIADIWRRSPLLDELRNLRVRDYTGCSSCGKSGAKKGDSAPIAQCAGMARSATGSFTGRDAITERMESLRQAGSCGSAPQTKETQDA